MAQEIISESSIREEEKENNVIEQSKDLQSIIMKIK
jgi:hypothetical protein